VTGRLRFGLVGGGWRAEFFLRVAQALPDRFEVVGAVVRDPDKGRALEQGWGVPTHRTLDGLLGPTAQTPDFVVVSVLREAAPAIIRSLAERGVPVLTETPAAPDVAGLLELWPLLVQGAVVEVAEQYHLQPLLRTQIELARSGLLGPVTHAQVSVAHDYHGVSILRRLLGVGAEEAVVTAHAFTAPLVEGATRSGPPRAHALVDTVQTIAYLDYGDRTGVFDFTKGQYFSWVRTNRLLARGPLGEVRDEEVRFVRPDLTQMLWRIERVATGVNGNHEGHVLRGLIAGDEWRYRNPFEPARLSDDELAVAELLVRMGERVRGGPSVYSFAEAAQDHYLQLVVQQSVREGRPVRATAQPWAW